MLEDIALMRALPNMYVYTASTDMVTKKLIEKIAKDTNPTYVRLYRMETEEHYENLTEKEMEKHIENGMIVKGIKGKDLKEHQAILFTMGDMIDIVYNVQKELEEKHGISSLVIDVIRLKPFNEEFVVKILNVISDAKIVTIEDHSIYGGLRKYNI
jgi:putative transketolase C-terminal section